MSGTRKGGKQAATTNKTRHGANFYKRIGSRGGQAKIPKGFALDHTRAVEAGRKGGIVSRKHLTLSKLQAMQTGEIFKHGLSIDSPRGINLTGSGAVVRWVAVRGQAPDWAIYVSTHRGGFDDFYFTSLHGNKIHDTITIKRLVPCSPEAQAAYRH